MSPNSNLGNRDLPDFSRFRGHGLGCEHKLQKRKTLHTFSHLTQTLLAQRSEQLVYQLGQSWAWGEGFPTAASRTTFYSSSMGRKRHDSNHCLPEPLAKHLPDTQKAASNFLLISHIQPLQRQKAFAAKSDPLLIDGFTCWFLLCANKIQNTWSLGDSSHGAE